nr:hypothetical protein [uncultured Faecalimonas sp.]
MADISKELEAFRKAVYGEEVRGALISVAEKTNEVSEATERAEKTRVSAEKARVSAENTRVSQEAARKTAETARSGAEAERVEAENTRVSQEAARVKAETARGSAETKRADAEKLRVSQEASRKTAESGRVEAENTRTSQESARVEAEVARANAEKARGTAETNRINAEKKRQTDTAAAIDNCNTATDRANKAAQDAEDVVAGKGFIASSEKGAAGGVATLDSAGKVPDSQMPDIGDLAPVFAQASARTNLTSQEKLKVSLGKIMKWFADLKAHAFANPVNNLTGADPDYPLAAPQGKALNDKITELTQNVVTKTMMSNQQVNSTDKVPTSALVYIMQQNIGKLTRSRTIDAWWGMGIVRSDGNFVTVFLNGVFVGEKGSVLKTNNPIIISVNSLKYTLSNPEIVQRDCGVTIKSAVKNANIGGDQNTCVFTTTFTLSS